jgi:Fe-S-cluster containining protein
MSENITRLINWELDQPAFRQQIKELINDCRKNGKVIPLPFVMYGAQSSLDMITVINSQVNCDNCSAPCCKANPNGEPTQLLPGEYERLLLKYGDSHFIQKSKEALLKTPCPFLKKDRCIIYPDRPLVCVFYPFQPGAINGNGEEVMALASSCPEARRIARSAYMSAWRIRIQYRLTGDKASLRRLFE